MRILDVLRERSPGFQAAVERAAARLRDEDRPDAATTDEALAEAVAEGRGGPGASRAAVEAIVLADLRPAWFIDNDRIVIDAPSEQTDIVTTNLGTLEAACREVGRVDLVAHQTLDYAGTGWLVAPDIAVTNRHVAQVFARAARPDGWTFAPGRFGDRLEVRLNPLRQRAEDTLAPRRAEVAEILYVSPRRGPDLAFLRLVPGHGLTPLALRGTQVAVDLDVGAIGYPAWDGDRNDPALMDRIFGARYEVKRFSPGRVIGHAENGRVVLSDYTSLGGNSGSAVVDLGTGEVVGLHFAGVFREANHAVPSDIVAAALREVTGRLHAAAAVPETPASAPASFAGRAGYDPDFLGGGDLAVPLPDLGPHAADVAPVAGRDDGHLSYTHFTTIQSASRRLPRLAAVNIDGARAFALKRDDAWRLDGRIAPEHQVDNVLYVRNALDRGHMVRRKDPGWGADEAEAQRGEDDSFHYTNCAPQHEDLNQRDWAGLEDYILEAVDTLGFRACVMTGPVFRDDDPVLLHQPGAQGVRIPESFWKIAVMVHAERGTLSATAYVLDQGTLIRPLTEAAFVFGEYKTYQVPITLVEGATGLDFGRLRDADPLRDADEAVFGAAVRRVGGPGDLRL